MSQFYPLTVSDITVETPECVSVAFAIPAQQKSLFQYIQGQYITLKTTIDGQEVRRSYSICSSPLENELRVAIKKVENGIFSTFANEKLHIGDTLMAMPPDGRFHTPLDPSQTRHYVAFAAGSGITPIMSIIKTVLATEPHATFSLVYGNKNRANIIFKEQIDGLKNQYLERFKVFHLLSREIADVPLFAGRISAEKCEIFFKHLIDTTSAHAFFLCGPEEMIEEVKTALLEQKVDPKKIHFELFTASTAKQAAAQAKIANSEDAGKHSKVTVIVDDTAFELAMTYGGETILDAALKAGADLPFACKGGVCCTCRAKVIEGQAEMMLNYALEPDEVAAGFILTCQSHPKSERLIVNFDYK